MRACGSWEGPLCQASDRHVGPWAGSEEGRQEQRKDGSCTTAIKIASTLEGDLRQKVFVQLFSSHCDTAGHKKAPMVVVLLWKKIQ